MLRLIRAMAGLADALAELRNAQQRLHQADTARRPPPTSPPTSRRPYRSPVPSKLISRRPWPQASPP